MSVLSLLRRRARRLRHRRIDAPRSFAPISVISTLALVATLGCSDEQKAPADPTGDTGGAEVVSDFSLTDVNPNSATHDESVSPRTFEGRVSAWYFGHAT